LFAPGGDGENLAHRMRYAERVKGTKVGFAYEQSGHFEAFARMRRQAERDAAEVRALAEEHGATRAIGFSRGARAIVGALAEDAALFERIALVIPPGGHAAGRYAPWLESLAVEGTGDLAADILVVGQTGDGGHPARVAEAWASQLGARLELLPSKTIPNDAERVTALLAEFFN
jgi:hypothetical protein